MEWVFSCSAWPLILAAVGMLLVTILDKRRWRDARRRAAADAHRKAVERVRRGQHYIDRWN